MTRVALTIPLLASLLGGLHLQLRASAIEGPHDLRLERDDVVWIEEGEFTMGPSRGDVLFAILLCQDEHDLAVAEGCADARFDHEGRPRRVHVATFGIDRTEVTHAAYRRCVAAGRCAPPRIDEGDARVGGDTMPVAGITAGDAEAYCAFAGGRLPTEDEWEKAARGDTNRRFPWGRFYHARLANHGRPPLRPDVGDGFRWAAPVGSFPDGASPYGVLDMAGNVYEWTSSRPSEEDFDVLGVQDQDPTPYRILRGGSWSHPAVSMRVTHRALLLASDARVDVGVRCAYDPPRAR
ncbi:formylglycine-generating enzyme family protein [Sandaracinus amylolyticus]|uniref:Sulfatase modifying factor 1 n=1 Tax=Sandaracinus amylolyticus TaxID=927083 RepID=A0A0F6W7Q6_9BACT|nr:SUMF1/EgtB/PvdO family nonheme iron enzyme [Sandaracinus amylolyticus]AKF09631.1 Sulfatase modifying factor 1 precursor [Sandaracinus amylolyticus]